MKRQDIPSIVPFGLVNTSCLIVCIAAVVASFSEGSMLPSIVSLCLASEIVLEKQLHYLDSLDQRRDRPTKEIQYLVASSLASCRLVS